MSEEKASAEPMPGRDWSIIVFWAGVQITAVLLGVSWYISKGGSVVVWSWLFASLILFGPYLLSAFAIRAARKPGFRRGFIRTVGIGVFALGVPGALFALDEPIRFDPNGSTPLPTHLMAAVAALFVQYPAALVSVGLAEAAQVESEDETT